MLLLVFLAPVLLMEILFPVLLVEILAFVVPILLVVVLLRLGLRGGDGSRRRRRLALRAALETRDPEPSLLRARRGRWLRRLDLRHATSLVMVEIPSRRTVDTLGGSRKLGRTAARKTAAAGIPPELAALAALAGLRARIVAVTR